LRLSAFCLLLFIWRRVSSVVDPVLHCWIDLTKGGYRGEIFCDDVQETSDANKSPPREEDRLSERSQ
jgi:hypothetical protein